MSAEILNDNDASARVKQADAHGQAALVLVESLLHGLIEKSIISVAAAVEIVDAAVEVNRDSSNDLGHPQSLERSIALLEAISHSLKYDLPKPR